MISSGTLVSKLNYFLIVPWIQEKSWTVSVILNIPVILSAVPFFLVVLSFRQPDIFNLPQVPSQWLTLGMTHSGRIKLLRNGYESLIIELNIG